MHVESGLSKNFPAAMVPPGKIIRKYVPVGAVPEQLPAASWIGHFDERPDRRIVLLEIERGPMIGIVILCGRNVVHGALAPAGR